MKGECCGSCKFFLPEDKGETGMCRRYPPQAYVAQQISQMGAPPAGIVEPGKPPPPPVMVITGTSLMSVFPSLQAVSGWCGEWSRNPEGLN